MTVQHKHLIVRAEVSKPPTNQKWAHTWLTDLVSKIGMQICQGPITTYLDNPGNRGLTGLVIIETSHIALHCWDETDPGLLQLDVYTCGDLPTDIIFEEIYDPSLPDFYSNEELLIQIFTNLIKNGCEAQNNKGKIILKTSYNASKKFLLN